VEFPRGKSPIVQSKGFRQHIPLLYLTISGPLKNLEAARRMSAKLAAAELKWGEQVQLGIQLAPGDVSPFSRLFA
jgi:hypothetical protein